MLSIALAAQIVAAAPESPRALFSADDVPDYIVRRGTGAWSIGVRVTVSPEGRILRCEIEVSSGIADLDTLTCSLIGRRARFRPARIDGAPVIGVARTNIDWIVAAAPFDTRGIFRADLDIMVNRLPARQRSPARANVAFIVDAQGNKSNCAANDDAWTNPPKNDPALVAAACKELMRSHLAVPAKDESGKATLSVQNASARFVVSKSR